jgi:hypothetical protein
MITMIVGYGLAYVCLVGLIILFFHNAIGDESDEA